MKKKVDTRIDLRDKSISDLDGFGTLVISGLLAYCLLSIIKMYFLR